LVNLPFGGDTPFTAEVYFVNKVAKLDMKWGTKTPFTVQEPKYNTVVRVRVYGQFGIRVASSSSFISQIVGALHEDQVSDYQRVSDYFRGLVLTKVQDSIAKEVRDQRASIFDLTGSLSQLSSLANDRMKNEFDRFGIEVLNFYIESINFPEEDLKHLKETLAGRARLDVYGERYREARGFDVLEKAAENPGGPAGVMAGLGAGLGAGVVMGGVMADAAKGSFSAPQTTRTTARCLQCGKGNVPGSRFCSDCGKPLTDNKCPKCSAETAHGDRFCGSCGQKLEG
jgi:membrane protease subunit (stomatin/prohibitin family)